MPRSLPKPCEISPAPEACPRGMPGCPAGKPLQALSGERRPGFDTILKVIRALGLTLHAEATRGLAAFGASFKFHVSSSLIPVVPHQVPRKR